MASTANTGGEPRSPRKRDVTSAALGAADGLDGRDLAARAAFPPPTSGTSSRTAAETKFARQASDTTRQPLVSVIMFVRNGMPHVKRALNSVLTQDYANLEFVIQDGSSTDGTAKYIRDLNDPRIQLVSEPDGGPADAFAKAVLRCKGDVIASCLYDEELTPGALSRVIEIFQEHPHLGAITGDAYVTDIEGNIQGKFTGAPFNLIKYLKGEYCPYWCSSFFNTNALRFVGVFDKRWSKASLEFEIWIRLATDTDILYVPEIFSKYAHHANQLSQSGGRAAEEMNARLEILRKHMFGPGKYFGENYGLRDIMCLLQLRNLYNHFTAWQSPEADKIYKLIVDSNYLHEFNEHQRAAEAAANPVLPAPVPAKTAAPSVVLTAGGGTIATPVPPPRPVAVDSVIPMDEFVVPRTRFLGKLYAKLTPHFIRAAISRDAKIWIARRLGLRRS